MTLQANKPKRVILHCTASDDFAEGMIRFDAIGRDWIDKFHREKKGWDGIGYHYVIRRTGVLENGRDVTKIGAHTQNHNTDSIGVVWVGTMYMMPNQLKTLLELYDKIKADHKIGWENWFGHNEFTKLKTCPGFTMVIMRELLKYYELSKKTAA